ncbi:TM2 domain-containing protein [Schleiferilactobacillus harbinensis]|uniref:TM2 domain-containing protein n=1 Tax=Schleiferilactobacillus harbinensis TaxID=304207 RepID=UPI00345EF782
MQNAYLLHQLTTQERILVNSEVEKRKKSTVAAYLLWWFTGIIGGHRYYMGKTGSAVAMTLITVLTFGIGIIVTGIWWIVDAFSIPRWIQEDQDRIEVQAATEILNSRPAAPIAPRVHDENRDPMEF